MGDAIAAEVRRGIPRWAAYEWILLLYLALAADDETRQGVCNYSQLAESCERCEGFERDDIDLYLRRLDIRQVLTYQDITSGFRVAYEIHQMPDPAEYHAPPSVPATPPVARPTDLYHWWDAADVLLYIGITHNLTTRSSTHAEKSSWMDFAVRSAAETYPSREEAERAETAAILAEHPIFNHKHNDTPEARRRQVEYLIKHDRLDLLAPAISRG